MGIDAPPILHLNRDTLLADGENEVDFRFCGALGKVGNVEMRNSTEEGPDSALGYGPR